MSDLRPSRPRVAPAIAPAVRRLLPAVAVGALASGARDAGAQLYALPTVQSPFPGRALAVAVNGGAGAGAGDARALGAAVAAHRPGGRFAATLGVGRAGGFEATRLTYAARVAFMLRFGETGAIGAAPFAGFGRVAAGDSNAVARGPEPRLTGTLDVVPVGVGLGYRRLVAGRAVTVHLTPQAQWWRRGAALGVAAQNTWYVRAAAGADVALTSQLGLSVAAESGARSDDITAGPRGALFGVALSYAPGRPRRADRR